jgi:hypothetical protein
MVRRQIGDRVRVIPSFACYDGCIWGAVAEIFLFGKDQSNKTADADAAISGYLIHFDNGMKKFLTDTAIE